MTEVQQNEQSVTKVNNIWRNTASMGPKDRLRMVQDFSYDKTRPRIQSEDARQAILAPNNGGLSRRLSLEDNRLTASKKQRPGRRRSGRATKKANSDQSVKTRRH